MDEGNCVTAPSIKERQQNNCGYWQEATRWVSKKSGPSKTDPAKGQSEIRTGNIIMHARSHALYSDTRHLCIRSLDFCEKCMMRTENRLPFQNILTGVHILTASSLSLRRETKEKANRTTRHARGAPKIASSPRLARVLFPSLLPDADDSRQSTHAHVLFVGCFFIFPLDDLTKLATCFHKSSVPLINSRFGRVWWPHISAKKDRRIQDF